jgi:hypothetical protein
MVATVKKHHSPQRIKSRFSFLLRRRRAYSGFPVLLATGHDESCDGFDGNELLLVVVLKLQL